MKAVFEDGTKQYTLEREYAINMVNTKRSCPKHTHGYVEFVYNFHGRALHCVDGKRYILSKGDMLFINYGSVHSVEPQGVVQYADIMLKPEFLDESLKGTEDAFLLLGLKDFKDFSGAVEQNRHFVHFHGDDRRQIEYLIDMTVAEQRNERSGAELMRRSALNMLLGLIFRNMAVDREARLPIDEALLKHIEEHCGERLTMEEMARRCYYTSEHFSRSFKKYTGVTFTEYLNSCRIKRAKELLETTDRTVEEIFAECGFSNRTSFFKSFSAVTGHTPLQYRKISKNGTFLNQ